jgi:hypothetical protein
MDGDPVLFSQDYESARNRFRAAALRLGCALEAHAIESRGPSGEQLAIDVAILGSASEARTLILSSGLHGVEGFFGSALQLGLLERWERAPDERPPLRCVFVHAINPYGFAWRRRVDEHNVDLNRNFLGADEAYRGSPAGYARLDALLNPRGRAARFEPLRLKLIAAIARYGIPALKQAIAGGQYDYPQGLFYGGSEPARANRILSANFERWLGGAESVVHLDLHTGLGQWARCKLLVDHALSEPQGRWISERFGRDAFETPEMRDTQKVAYATRGNFLRWGLAHSGGRQYLAANAEFGTYGVLRAVAALRAENQCHHWHDAGDASLEEAKRELVEVFCPRSDAWRTRVLERGREIVGRAIGGLVA